MGQEEASGEKEEKNGKPSSPRRKQQMEGLEAVENAGRMQGCGREGSPFFSLRKWRDVLF